jgi:hypothetical protein
LNLLLEHHASTLNCHLLELRVQLQRVRGVGTPEREQPVVIPMMPRALRSNPVRLRARPFCGAPLTDLPLPRGRIELRAWGGEKKAERKARLSSFPIEDGPSPCGERTGLTIHCSHHRQQVPHVVGIGDGAHFIQSLDIVEWLTPKLRPISARLSPATGQGFSDLIPTQLWLPTKTDTASLDFGFSVDLALLDLPNLHASRLRLPLDRLPCVVASQRHRAAPRLSPCYARLASAISFLRNCEVEVRAPTI